jgi:hypothetical protein
LAVLCISEAPHTLANDTLEENSWTALPEYGTGNSGVATVDGKIYVITYDRNLKNNIILVFNPQTNNWTTKIPTFDTPWEGAIGIVSTAVFGDKIYCFGTDTWSTGILNNKVYSTTTNHWSTITPEPQERYGASSCIVGDKIYVIGGFTYDEYIPNQKIQPRSPIDLVEMYDPVANTWTTKQPMPKPVDQTLLVVVEDKIFAFGGGYIQKYDTQTGQWRILSEYNYDGPFIYGGSTTGKYAPQKIYLFGYNSVQVFDTQTQNFTDNIPFPDHTNSQYPNVTFGNSLQAFRVAVVDDVFYLIGGAASGTLEKQWVTPEGRVKKSSETVSVGVDYMYVPLGYRATSPSDGAGGGLSLVFTVAGIVVAAVVIAAVGVLMFYRKPKQNKSQLL